MQQGVNQYQKIAQTLIKSNYLIITAGAGMGVDSGLPDFRGPQGFWTNYKAFRDKFQFWQCANPQFQIKFPQLFWGFYGHRLELYRKTQPHQGFHILKDFCLNLPQMEDHFILTSNVDGHFQKSGFEQKKVFEFHGSINHFQCDNCFEIFDAKEYSIKYDKEEFKVDKKDLPICKMCKQQDIRPNILMFNDYSFQDDRVEQQSQEFESFFSKIKNHKNNEKQMVVIELGAGLDVQTTRMYSEQIFLSDRLMNIMFVRINPRDFTGPKHFENQSQNKQFISLQEGALSALTKIQQEIKTIQNN